MDLDREEGSVFGQYNADTHILYGTQDIAPIDRCLCMGAKNLRMRVCWLDLSGNIVLYESFIICLIFTLILLNLVSLVSLLLRALCSIVKETYAHTHTHLQTAMPS